MRIIKILSSIAIPFYVVKEFNEHERRMKRLSRSIKEATNASLEREKLLEEMARFRLMTYSYWINGKKITKHL